MTQMVKQLQLTPVQGQRSYLEQNALMQLTCTTFL